MPSEALVTEWPAELRGFVDASGTSLRLRAKYSNFWVWICGPIGLFILGLAAFGLVTEPSLGVFIGMAMAVILGGLFVADSAFILFGYTEIQRTDNEWLVAHVLGRFRRTRRFPRSAVRVARKTSGVLNTTPTDVGPHIELEIDRARPVRLGGGFYLEKEQLDALARVFGVDLIGMTD